MQTMWFRTMGGCVLAAVVCLTGLDAAGAESREGWHSDLKTAARESRRLQKPMLIEITAVWCGYCTKMKKTYGNEMIARHVTGCFVPVTVDADENQRLVEAVGADALPTTVIVSPDFKLLKKITGYYTPRQLEKKLGEICHASHEVAAEPFPEKRPASRGAAKFRQTAEVPARPAAAVASKPSFDGHCLVSLLDDQRLKLCDDQHSATYKGQLLYFATADYKARFLANPEKYWPSLDGACPVSLADENQTVPGRAIWGAIYHGELWFFANKAKRDQFAGQPKTYISRVK